MNCDRPIKYLPFFYRSGIILLSYGIKVRVSKYNTSGKVESSEEVNVMSKIRYPDRSK